jgi:alpha-amylase
MEQNRTLIQFFEWYCPADGNHWNHFAGQVDHLLSLGITAAWLPPAYKGTRGPFSEGYDVYDIYDLGEFDQKGSVGTKYGKKEEYIKAVNVARSAGLQIYIDVVLNHMGGGEETEKIRVKKVDPDNRLVCTSDEMEIEAYTRFTFPGRAGKHSTFTWDKECFTGLDYAANTDESAIFNIINKYGDDWEPLVHNEKGSFDYLMLNDIETRNPAVREELKRWVKWYYKTVPFDGVRLDAVKHINPGFFIEWLDYIRAEVNPSLLVIGEYWLSDDLPVLLKYIEATEGRMSLFDAPLHHNFSQASELKNEYDLRNIFKDTLVAVKPDLAITFVDNHDTQPLQSLEEFTEQWFKPHAYAMILLRREGYPCVFYPDLYSACYKGKKVEKQEQSGREEENEKEKQKERGEEVEVNIPVLEELAKLLELRKDIAYGEQEDYFDDPHCIGWVRRGDRSNPSSGCAVILSNDPNRSHQKKMEMGNDFAHAKMYDALGNCREIIIMDEKGKAEFPVNPASVSVWRRKTE